MQLNKKLCSIFISYFFCSGIFLLGCDQTPNAIEKLPILPEEIASDLKLSLTTPMLTNIPETWNPILNYEQKKIAREPNISQSYNRIYRFSVVYGVTICYDHRLFLPLVQNLEMAVSIDDTSSVHQRHLGEKLMPPKYYKLLSYNKKPFKRPLFCTVYGGPHMVKVNEIESCDPDLPNNYTLVFEYGVIKSEWTWQAYSLEPIPMPDNMEKISDIFLWTQVYNCCPEYKFCNGFCIPSNISCQQSTPQ